MIIELTRVNEDYIESIILINEDEISEIIPAPGDLGNSLIKRKDKTSLSVLETPSQIYKIIENLR